MYDFEYHKPEKPRRGAATLAQHDDFKLLAGGMSLLPTLKLRLARYSGLVDLGALDRAARASAAKATRSSSAR